MKNLILFICLLLVAGCSADLIVEKGQYVDYCNLDEQGRLVIIVKNIGSEDAGESAALVTFGKYGFEIVPTPALGKGETTSLAPVYIPRGCYDSDCGFDIIVDKDNVVSEGEAGEANNRVLGNCIG